MSDFVWTYTSPSGSSFSFGAYQALELLTVDGLDGFDDVRNSSTPIPRGHGSVKGQHFLGPRVPVFGLEAIKSTAEDLDAVRQQFMDVMTPSIDVEGTLEWERPGQAARLLFCRPVSAVWPTDAVRVGLAADPKVAFEAADPRMYAAEGKTVTLQPYTAGGGLDHDVDWDVDFTVTGSEKNADNDGNTGAPVVARFYGPDSGTCTAVRLINTTTGVELEVETDIVSGQILTVDTRAFVAATGARVVDLSGSGRYGAWSQPREPLMIEPGEDVLRFEADGSTDGMRCRVDWSDAWLS